MRVRVRIRRGRCADGETGYLYFHKAPDARSFHQECVRRVKNLHTADCLRANKYAPSPSSSPPALTDALQVDHGVGPRGTRALPGQGLP